MRNRQRLDRVVLLAICQLLLVVSCSNGLGVTVFYDQPAVVKPGDPVRWQEQQIGTVASVSVNPQGRVAVALAIQPAFRNRVTDQCRFVLMEQALPSGQHAIDLTCLAAGGNVLSNGAEVEGLTTWGLMLEQGRRGLHAWSQRLKTDLERWEHALKQLPVEAWTKELDQRIAYWTRELQQASEETRRFFQQEVLPTLEDTLRKLKQLLPAEERDEIHTLEQKLDALKRI